MLLWWVCKSSFFIGWLCMNRKIGLFRKSKNVSFTENLPKRSQKRHSSANQTLFIYTSLSLLPIQKKTFSALHLPLAPSHNLLSAKNTAILFLFALTPYAVTPEPRTDSKPFRRRLVRKTGFDSCRRKTLLKASSIEL